MGLFGSSNTEHHKDGSSTERFSGGTSVTRDERGETREYTKHETVHPLGGGDKITTTYGSNGEVLNVQKGWGNH